MLPEPLNTIRKKPLQSLYVTGVLLLVLGAWLWWAKLSTNPQRVFWQMIDQSLSTSSVTIEAEQSNGNSSLHQTVQYSLGATNISHTLTTLRQNGSTVVDELVGTPTADYTRYLSVNTDQKGKDGKPLDFSRIVGVWARSDQNAGKGQLFSQSVLGTGLPIGGVAVPIGNFQPDVRSNLVREMKNDAVYRVSSSVKKQRVHGRGQYTYDVSVQPVAYAALMQRFARALGLHELDALDPSNFKGQQALKLQMTVDVRSRHLVAAQVAGGADRQTYSSYDIPVSIVAPKNSITVQQLQQRLSDLH